MGLSYRRSAVLRAGRCKLGPPCAATALLVSPTGARGFQAQKAQFEQCSASRTSICYCYLSNHVASVPCSSALGSSRFMCCSRLRRCPEDNRLLSSPKGLRFPFMHCRWWLVGLSFSCAGYSYSPVLRFVTGRMLSIPDWALFAETSNLSGQAPALQHTCVSSNLADRHRVNCSMCWSSCCPQAARCGLPALIHESLKQCRFRG